MPVPFARPWLGEAEDDAARRAILSGWVTQGPEVEAFEREFAAMVDAPRACAVSSGTTALHLALVAAGVSEGDEVITVSCSFIATANAIRYCRAMPVFVDVDARTYNIVPALAEAAIGPRTKAILCVHQLGMPCDVDALAAIARRHGVALIEDAACAVGSEVCVNGRWERIGRPHGDAACFSFHPRKLLTTGDGGMVTTRHAEWGEAFRRSRQHGMSVPDTVRHSSKDVIFETYPTFGYNYRLTDVQAAIGRAQLERLAETIARRRELAARYRELLAGLPAVTCPAEPAFARSNWQSYCVMLADGLDQRTVMQRMLDAGVATRRGVMCAHREASYPRDAWRAAGGLEVSERVQDRGVMLPLFHDMTAAQQEEVVSTLRAACQSGAA